VPIDPSFVTTGADWQVAGLDSREAAVDTTDIASGASGAGNFGSVLGKQLQNLADLQQDAATQSAALASGQASDPSQVVMSVERARLSMQLASQLRTKGVEAINEIFRTQV
jgi:flagellar hook-basal body complex protein FliE